MISETSLPNISKPITRSNSLNSINSMSSRRSSARLSKKHINEISEDINNYKRSSKANYKMKSILKSSSPFISSHEIKSQQLSQDQPKKVTEKKTKKEKIRF